MTRRAFTLIELLVVIAIIAILAVVVVLTLNPAQLLAQSRDANRVSDMATLQSALNLYTTDQSGNLQLGQTSSTYISIPDPNASTTCGSLGLPSFSTSTGQSWACSSSANYRLATSTGWLGINFNLISSGSPFGSEPVDPTNQTSTGLFYAYNTNGSQFQVTANLESTKYKSQYGSNPSTSLFPEVLSGGTPGISALYNPTGLVGYWSMNEGNGSTTIDQSGNGNNGTWQGAPGGSGGSYYISGKVGNYAGEFISATPNESYLGNPTNLQVASISVFSWVNPTTVSTRAIIFGNFNTGATIGPFSLNEGGGTYLQCITNGSSIAGTGAGTFANTGIWYFVGCTYNGSLMTLYINGAIVATTSTTGALSYTNGYPWFIGSGGTSSSSINRPWNGAIDDVRMYNRALSPAEVMALYNAEK